MGGFLWCLSTIPKRVTIKKDMPKYTATFSCSKAQPKRSSLKLFRCWVQHPIWRLSSKVTLQARKPSVALAYVLGGGSCPAHFGTSLAQEEVGSTFRWRLAPATKCPFAPALLALFILCVLQAEPIQAEHLKHQFGFINPYTI